MKEKRKEQRRKRKNFLPTLIVTFLLWMSTTGLVYFVDPETVLALPRKGSLDKKEEIIGEETQPKEATNAEKWWKFFFKY